MRSPHSHSHPYRSAAAKPAEVEEPWSRSIDRENLIVLIVVAIVGLLGMLVGLSAPTEHPTELALGLLMTFFAARSLYMSHRG